MNFRGNSIPRLVSNKSHRDLILSNNVSIISKSICFYVIYSNDICSILSALHLFTLYEPVLCYFCTHCANQFCVTSVHTVQTSSVYTSAVGAAYKILVYLWLCKREDQAARAAPKNG